MSYLPTTPEEIDQIIADFRSRPDITRMLTAMEQRQTELAYTTSIFGRNKLCDDEFDYDQYSQEQGDGPIY